MTPERWAQIREIFERALDSADRDAFLAGACRDDEELRREVESLLGQHSDSGDPVLDRPAWEVAGDPKWGFSAQSRKTSAWIPRELGKYRIVGLIGEGGMGAVYRAEQEHPRRIVALKVIRPGWASPELLRRFELESQALGRLQHPGIAQIYEAGTDDTGFGPQPYFAMEFIRGVTLREYVEKHRSNTRKRLELVARICDAVDHAHQRALIHRDLKPGNILVEDTGQPRILDFGVARVTDSDAQATRHTDVGQLVGTLAYMSPEQVLADPLELDTRSDVYSLGVILYELLADRLPYQLSPKVYEAAQTIREEDPVRLSSISGTYSGDIEIIVAKALEKDKTRRYGSAAALAADIRHHLDDEPITARPPSATYQLQKFARRHRVLVAGLAAVFVVLAGGIVASTLEAVRARRAERVAVDQRNRADTESATARAVNEFLQNDVLAQASASTQAGPNTKPDPNLKVRTALDRAAVRITGKFEKQPLVEAAIRKTISDTYQALGLYPEAQRQAEQALTMRRQLLGMGHSDTLTSANDLAGLYADQGEYPKAESLYATVLEIERRTLGEGDPIRLTNMNDLGLLYMDEGKYPSAEPLLTKVLEIQRRTLGEDNPSTLTSMNNLALLYRREGRYAEAEPLYSSALNIRRRVLGQEHPNTLLSMNNLAKLYAAEGRYDLAEPLLSHAMEIQRRVLGAEHPDTLSSMDNLAGIYSKQGKYARAEPLLKAALESWRRVQGEEHPDTLSSMNTLAIMYLRERKYSQAETLLNKVVQVERRVLGDAHPETLSSMNDLAASYRSQGKYAAADLLFTQVLETRRRVLGAEHPDTTNVMASLGEVWLEQGKFREAEPLLREALNIQAKTNAGGWKRYYNQSLLGASLAGQARYQEAEPLLISGHEGMIQRKKTIPSENRPAIRQVAERIVQLYVAWNKPAKVAEWRAKFRNE